MILNAGVPAGNIVMRVRQVGEVFTLEWIAFLLAAVLVNTERVGTRFPRIYMLRPLWRLHE